MGRRNKDYSKENMDKESPKYNKGFPFLGMFGTLKYIIRSEPFARESNSHMAGIFYRFGYYKKRTTYQVMS